MRWQWSLTEAGERDGLGKADERHVLVEADIDASIAALAEALDVGVRDLLPEAGIPSALTVLDEGDRPLGQAAPLSGARVVRGSGQLRSPSVSTDVRAVLVFRSGPLSGIQVPLPDAFARRDGAAQFLLGRADNNDIVIGDPSLAAVHARLTVSGDGVIIVTPADPRSRIQVNGILVPAEGTAVSEADSIELGASVLGLIAAVGDARADLSPDGQGSLAFNRPSRIRPRRPPMFLRLPGAAPQANESAPLPWAMATIPIGMAGIIAYISKQPAMLIMSMASPVLVVSNFLTQRRMTKRRGRNAMGRWQTERDNANKRLTELTEAARSELLRDLPDPAEARRICTLPGVRLWERRRSDPDALVLRVGVGELPLPLRLEGGGGGDQGGTKPEPSISPVPISVDLSAAGVLGVAGPPAIARASARWMVLQLAALRSPRDLRIVLLCADQSAADWSWLRWLPHAQTPAANAPVVLIGNTTESRTQRVAELLRELDERREATRADHSVEFGEQIVLIVDGARRLRTINGMTRLLREGPSADLFSICIDDDRSRLPEEATAEVIADELDATLGRLEATKSASAPRLLLDLVTPALAEECSRALAPVLHVGGEDDAAVLPAAVRFVDLVGVDLEDPTWVTSRWVLAGRSTRAVVGAGLDGQFSLDLKADGPHALVAGTTGAGKSEFLQTLVVGLALANRPDSLTFVLVDYKGASAFADCERLPHTVGMVTNLDNRETERALTSLDAELKRREEVLRSMGAKDVDDAWDRNAKLAAASALARLVIVIDEFAELVHELPDFVTGLIRIARVGRSLGVHLVLATQRPAGVVSAEMQANVGLRVGLRMANKADSAEVLESPDAALISPATPGRGFARRGGAGAPAAFQTARVAGRRPGKVSAQTVPPVNVYDVGWAELGQPLPRRSGPKAPDDPAATDLHALVELIRGAAAEAGIRRNPSPWLPALPPRVTVAELPAAGADSTAIGIGLQDLPAQQAQRPLTYDVLTADHAIIAGGPGSGRSSVLRTVIAGLAQRFSPDDVHLYCLDFGPGALLAAAGLPHCGAVISGTEPDRVDRLLTRLTSEIANRQLLLASRGLGDIAEQRAQASSPAEALPYLVLIIDRWEGLLGAYSLEEMQGLRERVIRLLREGPSVGVKLIVAGDRAVLTDRIAGFIATKYVLRLADREDYRLVNIRPQNLPTEILPGRAYFGDAPNEAQFAMLGADPSGQAQIALLRAAASELSARYGVATRRPFRVDVLPAVITDADARALPVAVSAPDGPFTVLLGVGGDDLGQYQVGFGNGPGFLVAGQRRSGRSTALALLASGLHRNGVPLRVVCAKASPLSEWAAANGVPVVASLTEPDEMIAWIDAQPKCAVVIDDADLVHGSDLDSALIDSVRARPPGSMAFVVGSTLDDLGSLLRGVAVEGKRNKQGLLLSPGSSMDGNTLGSGLPRNLLGRAPAGRGLILIDGEWLAVQLPIPDGTSA